MKKTILLEIPVRSWIGRCGRHVREVTWDNVKGMGAMSQKKMIEQIVKPKQSYNM
jgi:hypothetical protein